ncbi:hypothetical protein EDC04DRAFT_3141040 [Pisolithus marmoratus]|nr:hypothetical protein EDC04DRAFT_3141040 [Pisolithus marmoratus]
MATQDEPVNPMAPDYPEDEQESQIPPWVVESILPFAEQSPEVQPLFKHSQPGQPFGFKLPSQASTGSTQSTRSSNSDLPSGNLSIFSAPISRGSSVASSHPVSECGSNSAYQQRDVWGGSQLALPKWLSQLHMLAMAEDRQHPVHDNDPPSPPPRPPGLRRTQLFSWLPSTIAKSHTIFAKNTEGRLGSDEDGLVIVLEIAIDEVSPSEDDHCAEAVVHSETGDPGHSSKLDKKHSQSGTLWFQGDCRSMNMQQREIEDIVIQHCQCNCAPQLPDNTQLLAVDALDSLEGPISKMSSSSTKAAPTPLLATSVTSGIVPNSNSDPSHLQFYTPLVHDIIEHAKQISHCNIASINSFPLHAKFNCKAPEYMNKAIAKRCSQGLAIPGGWWPQYSPDITKLLWEDHGNWCSALKKKARTFIHEHYEWDPQNCRPINAKLAKSLLDHGNFLRHGVDAEGHMNNLVHPALSGLIINFFYMGSNAITSIFPEVFEKEVPCTAVVLTATTIKVALDKMVVEGKEVTFKRDIYADIYADLLGLMAKCDTVPIHCAKTKALCVEWAKVGMNGSANLGMFTGFDVELD